MTTDINKEIEELASDLAKAQQDPKEVLFETIRELGPEGIRAKLPTLEKSEQELLFSALEEMRKAVSMDKDYQAKYVRGNIKDTIIQEDKADDDQDEKLVKPEAAKMDHQGTPTEGWEGQVIKGKEPKAEKKDKEDKKEEKSSKDLVEAVDEVAEQEAEEKVKEHEEKMHSAKKKIKSEDKEKQKEGLKEMKKALEEKLGSTDAELIKGEMKKLLAEESQNGDAPEMKESSRAKKESVKELDMASDNKAAQDKVNEKKVEMKKAIWTQENELLKAMTGGRNHHFSLEEYLQGVLKDAENQPKEEVKKSETSKEDLNEIIAKGGDCTMGDVQVENMLKANKTKVNGNVVKSFSDNEIAAALGLTEEEAKKLLGE